MNDISKTIDAKERQLNDILLQIKDTEDALQKIMLEKSDLKEYNNNVEQKIKKAKQTIKKRAIIGFALGTIIMCAALLPAVAPTTVSMYVFTALYSALSGTIFSLGFSIPMYSKYKKIKSKEKSYANCDAKYAELCEKRRNLYNLKETNQKLLNDLKKDNITSLKFSTKQNLNIDSKSNEMVK